jgi:hypothetical protein
VEHLKAGLAIWGGMSSAWLNLGIIQLRKQNLLNATHYFWR